MILADSPSGTAGPLGLLLLMLIGLSLVLLVRNMNARLRRLPRSFDEPGQQQERQDEDESRSAPPP